MKTKIVPSTVVLKPAHPSEARPVKSLRPMKSLGGLKSLRPKTIPVVAHEVVKQ